MLKTVGVGLGICLQLAACGSGSSKKDNPQTAPVAPSAPVDPNAGLIDETKPADVDLQNHIVFDRQVDEASQDGLRRDFVRIERFDLTTGTENDDVLKSLLGVQDLQGATMSKWLKDRVRYMLNADLSLYRMGTVIARNQSLKLFSEAPSKPEESRNVAAVMIGAALYKYGKDLRVSQPSVNYVMIEVNDVWVHANTQRNGVMQIGPALFDPDFQPNRVDAAAYANTAVRVDTLFHEARHADGNSASRSLGFLHVECPADAGIAPEMVGQPACDSNANGPYTVGSRILKAYIKKCGRLCSAKDKTVLEAFLLDSVSRVVKTPNGQLPSLDAAPEDGFTRVDISAFALIPAHPN